MSRGSEKIFLRYGGGRVGVRGVGETLLFFSLLPLAYYLLIFAGIFAKKYKQKYKFLPR
jgi:hypothetical protein